ncbi:MAG: DUF4126 domain-containing protein [Phycisphaerae bacterium]|nr:DUF4126 domain-containing protein [Phycisphaerae bacterium]
MELIGSVCLGLGLAAACGFRVFLPVLALALASRLGVVELGPAWAWVGSWPAVAGLSAAALVELIAFYIPFVDNALDALAAPAAAIAGTLVAASQLTGVEAVSLPPAVAWVLAAIAGGGLATGVHLGAASVRGASTATTAGMGNPVVSTAENVAAAGLSAASIIMPVIAASLIGLGVVLIVRRRLRSRRAARRSTLFTPARPADHSGHGLAC